MGSRTASSSSLPHVPPAGVWCPAVTFFDHASDTVDLAAQSRYFAYLAQSGLTGIVVLGTNSEAFLLTREERAQVIRAARAAVGPEYPLMAGVGAHSTKQTLELARDAKDAGADYLLVLPPAYFGKATTMGVVKTFFAEVAAKAPLPVVVYNFPGVCNGVDIDSETITAIVRASAAASPSGRSNVVGVKLTCGSVAKITRLAATFSPDEFATFGGQADFLIGGLAAGSAGCIGAFANVFPRTTVKVYELYKQGRVEEAMKLQKKTSLAESPCKSGIAATKYAVARYSARLAGIEGAVEKLKPRAPYDEVGPAAKKAVEEIMAEVGKIEQASQAGRSLLYIIDLERKIEAWKRRSGAECGTPASVCASQDPDGASDGADSDDGSEGANESVAAPVNDQSTRSGSRSDLVASTLTNPLSTGPSTFMAASDGRTFYLGTSSNWSFTRRLLCMTHQYVHQTCVPNTTLLFDGAAYDLNWNDRRTAADLETPSLPTLDYAIYLINAVKFHCGQMFHLFDEMSFMDSLYDFYSDPTHKIAEADLWYIHFLIILAFGKAFTTQRNQGKRPPGTDYFVKAVQLLPNTIVLERRPLVSTEILCSISLYLQCLDYRDAAHNYIGQAMRIALCHGMHTDMPVRHLGEAHVERCRRAWWTTYVLDREMTSLMGLPQSIHDDDVHPDLPTFSGSIQRTAALSMQIKLSRAIARINRGVYGADGRLNSKFLLSTKEVLASIAHLADELRDSFPLQLGNAISGISRTYAYLHLLYHQCIVLATRPLLFCFLKIRFESSGSDRITLHSSQTTLNLAKMCMDSSQQMISILSCVRAQHLLETFLPFDLEAISVSTVNILLAPSLDPQLVGNRATWLDKAYAIFDEMAGAGNVVAEYRIVELRKLDSMLCQLSQMHSRRASNSFNPQQDALQGHPPPEVQLGASMQQAAAQCVGGNILPSPISGILDEICFDGGLAGAQIMDTVNAIDSGDNEWMSHEILEHSIW
ncbi:hypothetical protein BFW01_g11055 [Lasiodiplodia theobromae]|nr:hypothetical protein BFW01_g11055 [Lasiodiplodia theobromae]